MCVYIGLIPSQDYNWLLRKCHYCVPLLGHGRKPEHPTVPSAEQQLSPWGLLQVHPMHSLSRFPPNANKAKNIIFGSPRPCCLPTQFLWFLHWAEKDTTGYLHVSVWSRAQGCVAWTEQSGVALSILHVHQHWALEWKTAPSLVWIQTLQTFANNGIGCLPISASTALNTGAGGCFHQVERSQGLSQGYLFGIWAKQKLGIKMIKGDKEKEHRITFPILRNV